MSSGKISLRLASVRTRIARAAQQAGREPGSVTLIAVSKTNSEQAIREAYEAGQRDFGENYVQELEAKAGQLKDLADIRWHMIGHLQTNKAKQLVKLVHTIQSVDSERLIVELARRAEQACRVLPILLEVNVGAEEQKSGAPEQQTGTLVEAARSQRSLLLRGLMTVPPYELDSAHAARYFQKLRQLREQHGGNAALPDLSMGMSHDFEVAIANGATIVRVGTLIFGDRSGAN